ncbi:hypothetical protein ACIQUB_26960 [Rhizobium sp. NPDC090275]|uniref:hypothetical protein n=1 Tax=Rhizobium sp. NPDC090275 TaxID=3364498 RepID=UPI00383A9EA0
MISPIAVAFVTACTALVSSVVAPMITMRMGRAQIRASVISNNRQRWIETLRDLIAAFCAQVTTAAPMRRTLLDANGGILVTDPDILNRLQEIMKTFTMIRLMTNPLEADHQELIMVLTKTMTTLRTAPLDEDLDPSVRQAVEEVVQKSQIILKREWSRVKAGE